MRRAASGSFRLARMKATVSQMVTINGTKIDARDDDRRPGRRGVREHVLGEDAIARGADADQLDRDSERPRHELDVRAAGRRQLFERRRVVERRLQPGKVSHTGSAWWKSDWWAGKCSVSEPSRSR